MFDIDYLTDSMNYIPVSLRNQAPPTAVSSNNTNHAGTTNEEEESPDHIIIPSPVQPSADKVPNIEDHIHEPSPQHTDTSKEVDPQVPTTSTNSTNTGKGTNKPDLNEPVIPEPAISYLPDEGLFTEAYYDQEGVITELNNLPT